MRIAVLGNINLDLVFQVDRLPEPHEKMGAQRVDIGGGGAPANVAWWLARLGHEVSYVAAIGDDPLSGVALEELAAVGVDLSAVRRLPGLGVTLAVLLANGADKRMIGGRAGDGAGAARAFARLVAETDFRGFDHLHTLAQAHPLLFADGRRADLAGLRVSADLNGAYTARRGADFDLWFSNRDELVRKTGHPDPAAMLAADLGQGPHHAVITNGAEDVTAYRPEGPVRLCPPATRVVDRTGAGDAFCAGYLHATLAGEGPERAMVAGLALSQGAMSGHGCRPLTPVSEKALDLLRSRALGTPTTEGSPRTAPHETLLRALPGQRKP